MSDAQRHPDAEPRAYVPPSLDTELGGSLPCVVCGYELKGLSIRGVCPECGTAVRATILYKVDPRAEEFQPIRLAKLRATCLILWPLGALLAAVVFWILRTQDVLVGTAGAATRQLNWLGGLGVGFAALSGIALIPLLHPSRGTPIWKGVLATLAFLAYIPLVWTLRALVLRDQAASVSLPYVGSPIDAPRYLLRLMIDGWCILILLSFRPVARELVKRSLALRTGRVDRQTILGMAAVFVLIGVGDVLAIVAASQGTRMAALPLISTVIIGVGSVIVTFGFVSAVIDSWRIGRAIVTPSPSLRQVIEGPKG